MKIAVTGGSLRTYKADVLAVFIWEGDKKLTAEAAAADQALSGAIAALLKRGEAKGSAGELTLIHTLKRMASPHLAVVGLGQAKEFDLEKARKAGVKIIGQARGLQAKKVALALPEIPALKDKPEIDQVSAAQALVEALAYGNWLGPKYQKQLKKEDKSQVSEIALLVQKKSSARQAKEGSAKLVQAVRLGQAIGEAADLARDLVETPANLLTPDLFAAKAKEIAQAAGLKITILTEKQIQDLKMGAFWAVAQGSAHPPRLAVLEYDGTATASGQNKAKPEVLVLVGKGITFDSGGISLKPARKMSEMKTDMSGAASVLAAMQAVAKIKPAQKVIGLLPLCENMPSGAASRPGDVVKAMDGQTIEIITTDAEGRMILADALLYAKKLGATRIIDLATLTGACVVTLGDAASGIMGNDQTWTDQIKKAAAQAGEKVWELPLYPEYEEYIKSDIADMKNATEEGKAGTSKGGTFLKKFVGKTPWVHIDIAGTAYLDCQRGWRQSGPTGVGVATIAYLLAEAAK